MLVPVSVKNISRDLLLPPHKPFAAHLPFNGSVAGRGEASLPDRAAVSLCRGLLRFLPVVAVHLLSLLPPRLAPPPLPPSGPAARRKRLQTQPDVFDDRTPLCGPADKMEFNISLLPARDLLADLIALFGVDTS